MEKSSNTKARKSLKVAAIQIASKTADVAENLRNATVFAERAADKGAKLILFHELMPSGYTFTSELWNGGEPSNGPTVKWMKETSKRLGIWMGVCFLEAEGENFYNTFVLTNPEGGEDGRVRKRTACIAEAYFFKGDVNSQVIHSELGRVGVGICYDNLWAYTITQMHEESVDIMLQPHASPILKGSLFSKKSSAALTDMFESRSLYYANTLGVPVIYCNCVGRFQSPMPGLPFLNQNTNWAGRSAIIDSDGSFKARLGSQEGVIVGDVILEPARKKTAQPVTYGRWSMPNIHWTRRNRLIEYMGRIGYAFSRERKRRAKEISQ